MIGEFIDNWTVSSQRRSRQARPLLEQLQSRVLLSGVQVQDSPACQVVALGPPIPNPVNTNGALNLGNSHGEADGRYGASRSNKVHHHQGLDITAPPGTPVHSVEAGTVLFSGYRGGFDGYQVKVQNQDGTIAIYDHLERAGLFKLPKSKHGPKAMHIAAGTVLGRVGRTGNVPRGSGTHLHFQMFDAAGREIVPDINPAKPDSLLAPGYCLNNPQSPSPTNPTTSPFIGFYNGTLTGSVTENGITNPFSEGFDLIVYADGTVKGRLIQGSGTVMSSGSAKFTLNNVYFNGDSWQFTGTFVTSPSGGASGSGDWSFTFGPSPVQGSGSGSGTWTETRYQEYLPPGA
jgi:murein DD-endopeptidase MepM/ murein hydrolase activator NlpD